VQPSITEVGVEPLEPAVPLLLDPLSFSELPKAISPKHTGRFEET
jgi:hypothetical protein